MERIVAVHSKGIESFKKVLPERARVTARRIIFNDYDMFDEFKPVVKGKPPIKFSELASGIVYRNNGSAIPIANNLIRSEYNLPLIPDCLPDYSDVAKENINKLL